MKLLISLIIAFQLQFVAAKTIELTEKNTVVLAGMIHPLLLLAKINELESKASDGSVVYLAIYTNGGIVDVCPKFSTLLQELPSVRILIIRARSAGALISQAPVVYRYMHSKGDLMFHSARVSLSGTYTAKELLQISQELQQASLEFDLFCIQRMTLAPGQYEKNTDGADWYLMPDAALKYGAAEEIVDVVCSPQFSKNSPTVVDIEAGTKHKTRAFCKIITDLNKKPKDSHGKPKPKTK
jgi:ATP-dependent protease ClpP protease subunit